MGATPVPEGFHTITPYLIVEDPAAALLFYVSGLGAEVIERIEGPDGKIQHAEARIGDSIVMLGGARPPAYPALTSMLYLYVADTDRSHARAVEHGATSVHEPQDEAYGDRSAGVKGPDGNLWWFATRQESLSPEEIQKRMAERQQG